MNNLEKQIDELNRNLATDLPAHILEAFQTSIIELKQQHFEKKSIQVGDKFPQFSLKNTKGEYLSLQHLLKKGKLIIAFFRGSWCPYCNLELQELQRRLNELQEKSATLVAISPQVVVENTALKSKHHLQFEILQDLDNHLSKQLGIAFTLSPSFLPHYQSLGIHLETYNGNDKNELPIPAVFIVEKDKTISYRFLDSDYMNRIDIQALIQHL
ncbi:peroxiredoxin-like family protein [Sphingobacterium sp. LRF_L2]|uniref:peroxiredoxin-like family protein n=1 Tax=Sphingobacterium sp. LRF_L2 TaxID=3369421 RepID=UPI003F639384